MELLDLKNLKIIENEKVFTYKIQVNAGELLGMSMSAAHDKIQDLLKIGFKNKNLFVNVVLKDFGSETEEAEEDDFEFLCEMLVNAILVRNRSTEERTAEEKGKIMNTLPHDHGWTLPKFVSERVNCTYMTLRKCGDYGFINKALNIKIETENGKLLYWFVDEATKTKESEA